jgi:hypothetical protein
MIFSSLVGRHLLSGLLAQASPAQLRAYLRSRPCARSRPTSGRSSQPRGRTSMALLTRWHAVAPTVAPRLQIDRAEQPLPILATSPLPLPALALTSNHSSRGAIAAGPRAPPLASRLRAPPPAYVSAARAHVNAIILENACHFCDTFLYSFI